MLPRTVYKILLVSKRTALLQTVLAGRDVSALQEIKLTSKYHDLKQNIGNV